MMFRITADKSRRLIGVTKFPSELANSFMYMYSNWSDYTNTILDKVLNVPYYKFTQREYRNILYWPYTNIRTHLWDSPRNSDSDFDEYCNLMKKHKVD